MQIPKFLAAVVVLTASACQAEIVIGTSRPDEETFYLVQDLVHIVTSCYKDRTTAVGLAGNLPDTLIRTLSIQHSIPTILMDDTSHKINATTVDLAPNQFRYELQVFIVGVSSPQQLSLTVQLIIKTSIWWNHMASFIILDRTPNCNNVPNYLWIAWQLDLLNANVMCLYRYQNRRYIFNYNPFTSYAPASWRPVHVFGGINNHPMTVFSREYLANDPICVDLDFIKTNNLGNYEIGVEGNDKIFSTKIEGRARTNQLFDDRKRLVHIIFGALNAIPKFTGRGSPHLSDGTQMNMRYCVAKERISVTYPYQQFGIAIVSKFKGHKTQLEKIMSVTDINTRIGMIIVYLITMLFFKFCMRQALVPAVLNLVRMTCNTAFTNIPDNPAPRTYITGLLFFVVTMQGIYQGSLASLLTKTIPYRNIDSLRDLVNEDYKIYGVGQTDYLLEDVGLKERYITVDTPIDCVERVVTDLSAVCLVHAEGVVLDMARENDLHLSREFVAVSLVGFPMQPSWYLEEQLNKILGRLIEADIFESWDLKCNPVKLKDYQFDKQVLKNTDYKVLELNELLFAFVILGIGLACASVVFIIEVAIYRY